MNVPPEVPLVLSREQTRQTDRRAIDELGMSGLVLMENAGRGVADVLTSLGVQGPVFIACGKGNNAGDGFVIARHLENRGQTVRTVLFANPHELARDAAANYEIARRAGLPLDILSDGRLTPTVEEALAGAGWIVDALLGTGARGEPRPPLDAVIDRLNAAPGRKLAVDLPSGLDCDTGVAAAHTFRADHTCTFVAWKPGFLAPEAAQYTGTIHVIDIGAPRRLIEQIAAGGERR